MNRWMWLGLVASGCVAVAGALALKPPDALRAAPRVPESPLPACGEAQQYGHVPTQGERTAHRRYALPTLHYANGTLPETYPGLRLQFHVDATGRVDCWFDKDEFDRPTSLTPQRIQALRTVAEAGYAPFFVEGVASEAIVVEDIREELVPARHWPMPVVPLSRVKITLDRSGCFGVCPIYRVEVDGTGLVTYAGRRYVDVEGTHQWRIPPEDVAELVAFARANDLWSQESRYAAMVTDSPTTTLIFEMDGKRQKIVDYVGEYAGMPHAVTLLEEAIDTATRAEDFVHLSTFAVARLQDEGLDFTSKEAGAILSRATGNDRTFDDAAIAQMFARMPVDNAKAATWAAFLDQALHYQRVAVADVLLARGALGDPAKPDRARLDAAFRAAISGGSLTAAQKIWNFSAIRPSLTAQTEATDAHGRVTTKTGPVTLLVRETQAWEPRKRDAFALAQWLESLGCDVRASDANGDTLLHFAAEGRNVAFVQWLLAQGADPTARGQFGLQPLSGVGNESIALRLLEAGSKPDGVDYPAQVRSLHWARVHAWLQAHPTR